MRDLPDNWNEVLEAIKRPITTRQLAARLHLSRLALNSLLWRIRQTGHDIPLSFQQRPSQEGPHVPAPVSLPALPFTSRLPEGTFGIPYTIPEDNTILGIRHGQCRPVEGRTDEGLAYYCGAPVLGESSWCSVHHARYVIKGTAPKRKHSKRQFSMRTGIIG